MACFADAYIMSLSASMSSDEMNADIQPQEIPYIPHLSSWAVWLDLNFFF